MRDLTSVVLALTWSEPLKVLVLSLVVENVLHIKVISFS